MKPQDSPTSDLRIAHKRAVRTTGGKTVALVGLLVCFVLWAHLGSGIQVFRSQVASEPAWTQFRAKYRISHFGEDGHFVRAVQNGYNLFYHTHNYASRFTRKSTGEQGNSCAACHTAEDIAYAFVTSDRFDPKLGKRVSFEDRVRWCYAGSMEGFVPTIYDPAVRDIRLLARAVAHHLQLSEGALRRND